MLNFVLCDNNNHTIDNIANLFESAFIKADFDAQMVFKTTDYKKVLNFIGSNKVDAVILEVTYENTNMTGLDIAEKIRELNKNCYIIFVASNMSYITQAFQYKAFDYLFKYTLTVDTISHTLQRLFDDISNYTCKFLKVDNKGTFLDLNGIQYIEKNGMKLIYHTYTDNFQTYNSFSKIINKLPENFVRCHKSFIANINNISSISLSDNNSIYFKNDEMCYIGPKYKNCFMEMINDVTINN